MQIECPLCRKKYEIPLRHRGRKFRCVKCRKKLATKDATADELHEESVKNNPRPRVEPKSVEFQKDRGASTAQEMARLKKISMTLFLVGVLVIGMAIIESQFHLIRKFSLGASTASLDDETRDALADEAVDSGQGDTDGAIRSPSATTSEPSKIELIQNEPPADHTAPPKEGEHESLDSRGKAQILPSAAEVFQKPLLDPIPDFDPTWPTNNPNYALRALLSSSVNGARIEKFSRVYGSPTFIGIYKNLRRNPDFAVRFYSSLATANYGVDVEDSIAALLEAMAVGNARPGSTKLRLDLANDLLDLHRDRVPGVMNRLVKYKNPDIRGFAIEALANMGPNAKTSAEYIGQSLRDKRIYRPQDREIKGTTLSDISYYALRRLRANAADAVPVIMKLVEEATDPEERSKLKQIGLEILSAVTKESRAKKTPIENQAIGMDYVPSTMRYMFHYRPARLLESGFFELIKDDPGLKQSLEVLESTCKFQAEDIDLVTVAYINQAATLWHRKPFFLIVRTVDPLDMSRFSQYRAVKLGDKKRYYEVLPDLAVHIAGERTFVMGSTAELRGVVSGQSAGPPDIVVPSNVSKLDFFYGTGTFCVGGDFKGSRNRLVSEFEYYADDIATDTNDKNEQGLVFDYPVGYPSIFAEIIESRKPVPSIVKKTKMTPRKVTIPKSDDHQFALKDSRIVVTTWGDASFFASFPNHASIVFHDWLQPFNDVAISEWQNLIKRLDIERSPYSDAAGLITDELGQFNDLARPEVAKQIAKYFRKINLGPTTSYDFSGEESKNVFKLLQLAATWCDSNIIGDLVEFLDAAHFSSARKIDVISHISSADAMPILSNYIEKGRTTVLKPDTLDRIQHQLQHSLIAGTEETQLAALNICRLLPDYATMFNDVIEKLSHSKSSSEALKSSAQSVLGLTRSVFVTEKDYKAMERDSRDSGLANYGIENHREMKGDPPEITKLESFQEENRIFDVDLPFVDPDLEKLQLHGPVNKETKEYSIVNGLKYSIKNGEVIVVSKQALATDYLVEDWEIASRFMGDDVVSDTINDTEYDFDRQRLYSVQGLRKAQRLIVNGRTMYEVRWIGRNHDDHPDYVEDILNSFRVR